MSEDLNNKLVILARGQQEIREDIAALQEKVETHDVVIKEMTSTHAMTKEIHGYVTSVKGFFKVIGWLSFIIDKTWKPAVVVGLGVLAYWKGPK